jgi:hypothetical protein
MANKNTQAIYLIKDKQHSNLRFLAFKLTKSMSDIVREALAEYFKRPDIKKILDEHEMTEPKEQETTSTEEKSE